MTTKTCRTCSVEKPETEFAVRKETGGRRTECNACRAAEERLRRVTDAETIRAKDKARYYANQGGRRDKSLQRFADMYAAIKADPIKHEKEKERNRLRAKRYAEKWRAMVAKRRAAKLRATPPWLSDFHEWVLGEIYHLVEVRSQMTGFAWHADHIIPLQSESVCGLHVPWNLRVIPAAENRSKGNRLLETA